MVVAIGVGLVACGETKYDVFLAGQTIEGDAERGPCRLHYEKGAQAAPLTGDAVATCLKETERAIEKYKQAATLGFSGPEYDSTMSRANERRERLETMLERVRMMERDAAEANDPHTKTP